MSLFGPAWKSKNESRAIAAVQKMTDENELLTVALNRAGSVGLEALRRIQSQDSLLEAAMGGADPDIRLAGADRITDSSALRSIAENERDQRVRGILLDRLRKEDFERAEQLMQSGKHFAAAKGFWEIPWGDAPKKNFEECINRIALAAKDLIDKGQYKEARDKLSAVSRYFKLRITPVHPKWKGDKIHFDAGFFYYCYGLACANLHDFTGYKDGFVLYQEEEHKIALLNKAYETAVWLMDHNDEQNAVVWLEDLYHYTFVDGCKDKIPSEDIRQRLDECRMRWQRNPENPEHCPAGENGRHVYELIDSDYPSDKTVGWEKKRCKFCGKTITEEVALYW